MHVLSFKAKVEVTTCVAAVCVLHVSHTHAPVSIMNPDVFACVLCISDFERDVTFYV